MRDIVTLACTVCKRRNYSTTKNKKKTTDRLEFSKYLPVLPEARRASGVEVSRGCRLQTPGVRQRLASGRDVPAARSPQPGARV